MIPSDSPHDNQLDNSKPPTRDIDPDEHEANDYLEMLENSEQALKLTLKDDKKWWIVHDPNTKRPGKLNGPWLFWTTYPRGPWELSYHTRQIAHHHLDELYYRSNDGEATHSIHQAELTPISEAPAFLKYKLEGDTTDTLHD